MRINTFFIPLLIIIIIPGAYVVYMKVYSYSPGTLFSIFVIYLVYLIKFKNLNLDKSYFYIFYVLILIFVLGLISWVSFEWFEHKRFFLSYVMFFFCVIASALFVKLSLETNDKKIHKYVSIIFNVILFDGFFYFIKKKIFLSTEPFLLFFPEISHFSLIFLPLLLFKVFTTKKTIYIYMIILISLVLALTIQNLTLLVGTIFIMFIHSFKKTFFLFIIPSSILILFVDIENLYYFIERVQFVDTDNISALVFLSGWERAYLNLFEHGIFGIGFNQLGHEGQVGFYQEKINSFNLHGLNINDAGSVAPKLVSELGVLAVIMLSMYGFYLIKLLYKIKKYKLTHNYLDIFYISVFIMSFVGIFLRGSGYFSPIIFLFMSSIIYFIKFRITDLKTFIDQGNKKL